MVEDGDEATGGPGDDAEAFLVASRALVGVAAAALTDHDITLPQLRALVILSTDGPSTVGTLATSLEIHPSTTTRLCDRLVRKRLVKRTKVRSDRRTTDVALTAAGRRTVEKITERRRRAIAGILDRMTNAERTEAIRTLTAFASAAGEPSSADPLGWTPTPPPRSPRSAGSAA